MHTVMKSKLLVLLVTLSGFALDCSAEFRAGIAVRIVTPDPLLPASGGVGPSHPVNRKEGDLTVRALVLENNIDIAIQRYGPALAREVLRRAQGGGLLDWHSAFRPNLHEVVKCER